MFGLSHTSLSYSRSSIGDGRGYTDGDFSKVFAIVSSVKVASRKDRVSRIVDRFHERNTSVYLLISCLGYGFLKQAWKQMLFSRDQASSVWSSTSRSSSDIGRLGFQQVLRQPIDLFEIHHI